MRIAIVGSTSLARQVVQLAGSIAGNDVAHIPEFLGATKALVTADWIFELTGLAPPAKRGLLASLCGAAAPGALVSTDESIVPLAELAEGVPRNGTALAVTHVFAPPEHMRLVEISASPQDIAQAAHACATGLGLHPMQVPDTPGFLANRMGFYFIAAAMHEAKCAGLSVSDADAAAVGLTGAAVGAFALADLIGLDVLLRLDVALRARLPAADPIHACPPTGIPALKHLVAAGALGRASGGGFYRKAAGVRECLDLATFSYLPATVGDELARGRFAVSLGDRLRAYAQHVSCETGAPLDNLAAAMATGYGWKAKLV